MGRLASVLEHYGLSLQPAKNRSILDFIFLVTHNQGSSCVHIMAVSQSIPKKQRGIQSTGENESYSYTNHYIIIQYTSLTHSTVSLKQYPMFQMQNTVNLLG